jgi:hypothetical protein
VRVDPLAVALRHTPGIVALVALARERELDTVYVLAIDAREATLLGDVRVMPVPTLGAPVVPPVRIRSSRPASETSKN